MIVEFTRITYENDSVLMSVCLERCEDELVKKLAVKLLSDIMSCKVSLKSDEISKTCLKCVELNCKVEDISVYTGGRTKEDADAFIQKVATGETDIGCYEHSIRDKKFKIYSEKFDDNCTDIPEEITVSTEHLNVVSAEPSPIKE